LAVGVWQFLQRYEIEQGPQGFQLRPRAAANLPEEHGGPMVLPGAIGRRDTIRLASFNVQPLGEQKLTKPLLAKVLAATLRRFDLVAVQGIQATAEDVLAGLVQLMNEDGARYDYLLGPRVGPMPHTQQYGYIFNTDTITADRDSLYTVHDPDDLMRYEPLVAAFRTRGGPEQEAFTFTLINVRVDPARSGEELPALGNVFRAVRNDGRGEDDILVAGDFTADDRRLMSATSIPYLNCCIVGRPTTTRRTQQSDNILFDRRSAGEFANHAGVFDLQQELGLNLTEALEIADHLPVWADFYITEGGPDALTASRDTTRRE
jgi:hypothetical protein